MAQSVFDIVKAPLGWSIFADNVKIGGIHGSKEAALEAAALAASFAVREGAGVQINVPGLPEEKPNWVVAYEMAMLVKRAGPRLAAQARFPATQTPVE